MSELIQCPNYFTKRDILRSAAAIADGNMSFKVRGLSSFELCAAYQAVYDAFVTKPSDEVALIWNDLFVCPLVASGDWALLDYLNVYAVHTNGAGEALLNWKQPTGGSDVVTNGGFDTDTDWSKGVGWTIAGGFADCDGSQAGASSLSQAAILTLGIYYKITYTVSDYSAGNVRLQCGTGTQGIFRGANGTYTEYLLCAGNTTLYISGNADFDGKIDNVSAIPWTNAIAYNSPTFTASQGFLFNGTTQYIDNRFVPSASGVQYTQNSASQILYIRTNVSGATGHGTYGNTDTKNAIMSNRNAANNIQVTINSATLSTVANANGSGCYVNTRTAAAVNKAYRNKVAIINGTTASTGVPTHSFYVGCYNDDGVAAGFRADQVSCAMYGAGMDLAAVTRVSDAFNAAMTALGTNVY